MRKDLIFLTFVVLFGFIGVYYTKQTTQLNEVSKTLKQSKENVDRNKNASARSASTRAANKKGSRSVNLNSNSVGIQLPEFSSTDVSWTLDRNASYDQKNTVANAVSENSSERNQSNSQEDTRVEHWFRLYNEWVFSLISSTTLGVEEIEVSSPDMCILLFEEKGAERSVNFIDNIISATVSAKALTISTSEGGNTIQNLEEPELLLEKTKELIRFCR